MSKIVFHETQNTDNLAMIKQNIKKNHTVVKAQHTVEP